MKLASRRLGLLCLLIVLMMVKSRREGRRSFCVRLPHLHRLCPGRTRLCLVSRLLHRPCTTLGMPLLRGSIWVLRLHHSLPRLRCRLGLTGLHPLVTGLFLPPPASLCLHRQVHHHRMWGRDDRSSSRGFWDKGLRLELLLCP